MKIGPRGVLASWAPRFATCALFATACSRPAPPPPLSDAALEDTAIRFEQGGCYGTCAVYAVTLRGDGALDYEGKAFVAIMGHRSARVAPSAIAELVRHFDAVNFDGMTWRKNCPEKYTTDHGTVRLTLRRGDRSHTLDHDLGDGCAPADLRRLEDHLNTVIQPAIDDLVRCDAATCPGPGDVREVVSAAPRPSAEGLQVHTDVEGLRRYITLPEGITGCRWTQRTLGDGLLGPSDYRVTAFVELSPAGWREIACDGAAAATEPRPLSLDPAVARALLPEDVVPSLSLTPQGKVAVSGTRLPDGCVQTASVLHVGSADRIGAGLWIEAFTM